MAHYRSYRVCYGLYSQKSKFADAAISNQDRSIGVKLYEVQLDEIVHQMRLQNSTFS